MRYRMYTTSVEFARSPVYPTKGTAVRSNGKEVVLMYTRVVVRVVPIYGTDA